VKPVAHEPRQIAGVIEVSVGQHAPVDRRRLFRQRIPVPQPQLLETLKQSAIHQQPLAFRFDQILRSRYGPGRAKKSEFGHRADILMEVFGSRVERRKMNNTEDK